MAVKIQRLRPPIKCHGGKFRMAPKIVPLFKPHRAYIENFVGGGSVLLAKPRSEVEIASDICPDTIAMWQSIQGEPKRVAGRLGRIPYSRQSFDRSGVFDPRDSSFERAIKFIVRRRFSRGGMGQTFAWSERTRGGIPGDANAWLTLLEELPRIADRVRDVRFRLADGFQLPAEADDGNALIYADPPYLLETRTATEVYDHEITPRRPGQGKAERLEEDRMRHWRLLSSLGACRANVVISGYGSPTYDRGLGGWTRHDFPCKNDAGQGKTKQDRIESVWCKD